MPTGTRCQLSLASLFETMFCLAVGLSATIRPAVLTEAGDLSSPIYWLGVTWELSLATVACSLIYGLVRQLQILRNSLGGLPARNAEQQFSLRAAFLGRVVLLVVLASCLTYKITLTQGLIVPATSESHDLYHGWYSPLLSNDLFLLAIFAAVRFNQREDQRTKRKHQILTVLWSVAGILFLVIALRELLFITHLVYIAIGSIENAQAGEYHRPGAYINHVAEGHRFFWVACGGLSSLLVGATSWLLALTREKLADRRGFVIVGALGLGLAATYSYWYFTVGYPTLAPEFAEAGMQSRAAHWLHAGVIITLVIPFVAYRLAVKQNSARQEENSLAQLRLPFPVGMGMLIFGAIGGLCEILALIYMYVIDQNFGSLDIAGNIRSMLLDVNVYLPVAAISAFWMALWRVWRGKNDTSSSAVPIVDQRQFALACLALAVIVPVAIPTIAAFSFASWFNPWFV